MKKAVLIILSAVLLLAFCACNSDDADNNSSQAEVKGNEKTMNYDTKNPVVEIEIKDYGKVVAELYPDIAPNTVNNFISLIKKGFYDNNTMHRCIAGFMLQGGDPTGTGTGGPGYSIKGEFTANGFTNDLKHTEGVLSMARATPYDSAGSQFFIMLGSAPHLDGEYAAFGKVIEGIDVVKKVADTVVPGYNGILAHPLTITKVYVDTHGVTYPEPEKVK